MPLVTCYAQQYKEKSKRVLRAFCHGVDGVMAKTTDECLGDGDAAFYGVRPSWAHLLDQAKTENRNFYYLDNSWFDATREQYFRIGFNQTQSWSTKHSDGARFKAMNIEVKDWNDGGEYILICPQSDEFHSFNGRQNWLQTAKVDMRKQSDIPIKVRHKGSKRTLQKDLEKAHMLVTHSSACAIEALIAGVPVIVTDEKNPAFAFTSKDVNNPNKIDGRIELFNRLADSQWNFDELREAKWKKDG